MVKDWRYWFEGWTSLNKYIVGREAMHSKMCDRTEKLLRDATAGWKPRDESLDRTNGGQLRRVRSVVSKTSDGSAIQIKTSPMLQEGNAERYYLNIEIDNDWNICPHGFDRAGFYGWLVQRQNIGQWRRALVAETVVRLHHQPLFIILNNFAPLKLHTKSSSIWKRQPVKASRFRPKTIYKHYFVYQPRREVRLIFLLSIHQFNI